MASSSRGRGRRGRRGRRRRLAPGRAAGGLLASAALVMAAGPIQADEDGAQVLAADASGAARIVDSRGGAAIISASRLGPGNSVTGTVTITNDGTAPGALFLSKARLSDTPGGGGGVLSSRLQLKVEQVPAGTQVYQGSLGAMSQRSLGTAAAGAQRTYRFTLTMPHGVGDNAYREGRTSVDFEWRADTLPGTPHPPPTTAPPPPPTSTTPTTPPPAPPPPAGDTTAPRLSLAPGKPQKLKRGAVTVTATCDEPCRVTGVSRGAKASPASEIPAGKPTKLKLKLSKKDAKALAKTVKKRRKGSVALAVTAADRAGNRATAAVKVKLKR